MSHTDPKTWFSALGPDQRHVLLELRGIIKAIDPAVIEEIKWGRPCYSNARGLFCYLHSTKSYATLGFQKGASLDDPEQLLEGTGKDMRHIKLNRGRRAGDPAIVSLIRQAASL
jgi:hypothetical protein